MVGDSQLLRTPRRLPVLVERAVSLAVVPGDDVETIRTKRLLTGVLWLSLLSGTLSSWMLWSQGAFWAGMGVMGTVLTGAGSLLAMAIEPRTYPGVMHVIALVTIGVSALVVVLFGGFIEAGANSVWGILAVIGALAVFEDRRATYWLLAFVVSTVGAIWIAARLEPLYSYPDPGFFALFNLLMVLSLIYVALYYFVRKSKELFRESEDLLRNILPAEIADRLKESDLMIADEFDSASILFADIADFTPMTAAMAPGEVIDLLDHVFTAFDHLVKAAGLEKIKTIGDAYMAAAGVPVWRPDHAVALCDLALAMRERAAELAPAGRQIAVRIGIASGPVVAGIIGRHKFSYDLWGDTVNTASRMESLGAVNRIQIPRSTFDLVDHAFECEPRGTIEVKGKGPMETWFLVGRKTTVGTPPFQRNGAPG